MLIPKNQLNAPVGGSDPFKSLLIPVYNRSGSATVVGSVLMLDLADSESTANSDKMLVNAITPTTAGINSGFPMGPVTSVAADDAITFMQIGGKVRILTDGNNLLPGDPLKAANASTVAVEATEQTDIFHWISLETNNGAANVVIDALVVTPCGRDT